MAVDDLQTDDTGSSNEENRSTKLRGLESRMDFHTAFDVGQIHHALRKPLIDASRLETELAGFLHAALCYVCTDVSRVPISPSKRAMARQLVIWVSQTLLTIEVFDLALSI